MPATDVALTELPRLTDKRTQLSQTQLYYLITDPCYLFQCARQERETKTTLLYLNQFDSMLAPQASVSIEGRFSLPLKKNKCPSSASYHESKLSPNSSNQPNRVLVGNKIRVGCNNWPKPKEELCFGSPLRGLFLNWGIDLTSLFF